MGRLDPEHRELARRALDEWKTETDAFSARVSGRAVPNFAEVVRSLAPANLRQIADYDYIDGKPPVPMKTFIEHPMFLGGIADSIFPTIKDDLIELFDHEYEIVVLGGATAWGKTWMMRIGIAYEIYCLTCLRDPAVAYGQIPGSRIAFLNVSVRKDQAVRVFFTELFQFIKQIPYFQEVCPFAPQLQQEIRFDSKNIHVYPVAANEASILGELIFSAVMDEANFYDKIEDSKKTRLGDGNVYDQASIVFDRLTTRMRGRTNQLGKIPGHMWVASSARFPGDFTERLEQDAKTNPKIFVRHYAIWDTKPAEQMRREKARVEVGDLTRQSRILKGDEDNVTGQVIEFPVDFLVPFERNIDKALRDYGGISTLSIKPFMPRRDLIHAMFESGEETGLKNAFSKQEVTLQGPGADAEHLVLENLHWIEVQETNPRTGRPAVDDNGKPITKRIIFPTLHHAHFDLSKTRDATGVVVGHVIGKKKIPRLDDKTLDTVYETKPIIRVDLALRVLPPKGGEIDIPRCRAILYQLRNAGMAFGKVTFDQVGSQESVKSLKEQGFDAEEYSVDKTKEAYEALKDCIYDGRILCFPFSTLERELVQLEDTPKKIDHPSASGSSKDIADCLAAVVLHCEQGWREGEAIVGLVQPGIVVSGADSLLERAERGEPLSWDELDRLR